MFQQFQSELEKQASVSFYVRARPGMPKTKVVDKMADESIKIDIAAPAEGGKANAALMKYLAKEFEVSVSQIEIVSGKTARMKLIRMKL